MKKNKFLKLASGLLVLCLLTTCVISTTFAKYVTEDSASDTARVAKWGVTITTVDDGDSKVVKDTLDSADEAHISVAQADKLLAPGTKGSLLSASIQGKPEVAFNVDIDFTLTLANWSVDSAEYCPIVFTVNDVTYSMTDMGGTNESATVADLVTAVQNAVVVALQASANEDYAADATYFETAKVVTLSWAWAFDGGVGQTDEKDTALGDATTPATLGYDLTITATQID